MVSRRVKSKGGSPEEHPDRPPQSCCIVLCIIRESFSIWFDSLKVDQLKVLMTDNTVNERITERLRFGNRHEWLMVSNAAIAKSRGLRIYKH